MNRTMYWSVIESLESRRLLAVTDIDVSFGSGGRSLLDHFNDSTDYVDAVALTPGGKLLIGGSSDVVADAKATLARYNLDGTPDTSFGNAGKLRLTSGAGFADLVVNPDDTITTLSSSNVGAPYMRRFTPSGALDPSFSFGVSGLSGTPNDLDQTSTGKFYAAIGNNIVRVHPNGSADTTFGTSGRVTIAQEANWVMFRLQRVVAMPDGGVVAAGQYGSVSLGDRRAALRRFTATGALDTTFGTNGTFTIPGFSNDNWVHKLMLVPDGKLLMVFRDEAAGSPQSYIVRLHPNGSLDSTFHGDGIATVNPSATYPETIADVIRHPDGRLYGVGMVGGNSADTLTSFIFRMHAGGSIDTTFGTGGYNQSFFPTGQLNWGTPLLVLPGNGSLYHVTSNSPFGAGVSQDQLIFRFNESTGAHDTSFGTDGRVAINFLASLSQSTLGTDLLFDGSIAFAGRSSGMSGAQMIAGRMTPTGAPAAFGPTGAGTTEISFGTTESIAFDVLGQSDGKLIVAGRATTFNGSSWADDYALARLNPDGSLDSSFGTGGKVVLGYAGVDFEQITRLASTTGGKFLGLGVHQILGTDGERRSALLRFNANGSLDTSFADGGRLLLPDGNLFARMVPLADGSILLGGERETTSSTGNDDAVVIRVGVDGSIDPFFGGGGQILFDVNAQYNTITGLATDSSGRIYAASWDNSAFNGALQLRRFSASGAPDPTYGTNGIITHAFPSNTAAPMDMKLTADNKLLVYGPTRNSPRDVYLMSFLPSGDIDLAFGSGGRQQYDISGSDRASELHIGADGRWTLTGDANGTTTLNDFAALRLMGTDQPPDTTPPTIVSGVFRNATGHSIELNFSENVVPPDANDLTLSRLSSRGAAVAIQPGWLSYNPEAQRLRIAPEAPLPDGNYRLTVAAGSARDGNGNVLAAPYQMEFFVLAGDANGDRRVNDTDEWIVDSNFGQSNRTAQQGDFDFSGTVNDADRAILQANMNVWLPLQGTMAPLPVESFAANYRLRREASGLLGVWNNTAGTGAPMLRIVIGAITGANLTSYGSDVLVVDLSNGPLLDTGRIDYHGVQGSDTLHVIGSAGADSVTVDAMDVIAGTTIVRRTSVETITFDGRGGWDTLAVSGTQPLTLTGPQQLQSLSIAGSATAALPVGGELTLHVRNLSIAPIGKLNLADNDLLWDYTGDSPYTTLRGYILSGRDTGTSGIVSTRAPDNDMILAPIDNAQFGRGLWNNIPIDQTTLIGKYTWYGDSNLDGKVTGDDYVAVDSNLGRNPGTSQWFQGDFNFDGHVTGDDYVSIDANLGDGTLDPAAYDAEQAEMIALHAERYGGKKYVQEVERAATERTRPAKKGARLRAR